MQGSYVWSKALGEDDGQSSTLQGDYRTLRNMSFDKQLLSFDHRGVLKINGIYEIPVGYGRRFGRDMHAIFDAVIGGWFSQPTAANLSINSNTFGRITTSLGPRILVLQAS
jgi:hypothetical protein